MPTYDYICRACGHELEVFQSITERPKRKCPACGKSRLERRLGSGAAILFKGSGFYQTDYRSDSYRAGEKAEKSEGKPKESGEPKPAAEPKPRAEPKPAAAPKHTGKKDSRKHH